MNKDQLARTIASQTGYGLSQSKKILDSILEVIVNTLKNNQEVKLRGFGTFKITNGQVKLIYDKGFKINEYQIFNLVAEIRSYNISRI